MKKIIIAIDGFSSCGKSTMAKQLAKELNYVFVDSGAMYRAITLYFLRNNIDLKDEEKVIDALRHVHLDFEYVESKGSSDILLNNENVESLIRDMQISQHVSAVSANQHVREFAVAQQQKMGEKKGIVMDGRDIGTTVFPDAELKVFVTADVDVRVERRFAELVAKGDVVNKEAVKENLVSRDYIDSTREFSPLKQAADATVLDNSNITREEQLAIVLKWANEKMNA